MASVLWPQEGAQAFAPPILLLQQASTAQSIDISRPLGADELASLFSEPVCEVWLEIGFGAGEHLVWQAEHNPAHRHYRRGALCERRRGGHVRLGDARAGRPRENPSRTMFLRFSTGSPRRAFPAPLCFSPTHGRKSGIGSGGFFRPQPWTSWRASCARTRNSDSRPISPTMRKPPSRMLKAIPISISRKSSPRRTETRFPIGPRRDTKKRRARKAARPPSSFCGARGEWVRRPSRPGRRCSETLLAQSSRCNSPP